MADLTTLRRRLLAREHLIGTFVKTPTTHATEILGALGFDFVVIDEEHAPFDRMAIDAALLAARAAGTAALVRVQSATSILSVLDCGATGVLVPHVASAARAREVAATCRDLAVALGAKSSDAPEVRSAVERIGKAAHATGKPICVFVGGQAEASWLRDQGATAFVVASDQGFMRKAAAQALAEIRSLGVPANSVQTNSAEANGAQAKTA